MILIVDDYPDGGETLCALFTHSGYPCDWVASGREAIARIRSHPPEMPLLVVLDEMMPEMGGIEVVRFLREDPATRATSIVMLTAGFNVVKREQAMMLGVLGWFFKGQDIQMTLNEIIACYERVGGAKTKQPDAKT